MESLIEPSLLSVRHVRLFGGDPFGQGRCAMPKNLKLYLVSSLFSVDLKDPLSFISPFVQHFLPLIRLLCFLLISSSTTFSTLAFSPHLSLFTFIPVTDHSSTLNYISKNVSPCIFAKSNTVPLLFLCFMNFSPYNKYNSIAVGFYFTDIPAPELKFFFNILFICIFNQWWKPI